MVLLADQASDDQLDAFEAAWLEAVAGWNSLPPISPVRLRPLIKANLPHGFRREAERDETALNKFTNHVIEILLYAHEVALVVPRTAPGKFVTFMEPVAGNPPSPVFVSSSISLFSQLRQLLESGVVHLVPEREYGAPSVVELSDWELAELSFSDVGSSVVADRDPFMTFWSKHPHLSWRELFGEELLGTRGDVDYYALRRGIWALEIQSGLEIFRYIEALGSSMTPLIRTHSTGEALAWIIEKHAFGRPPSYLLSDQPLSRLQTLLEVDLPGTDSLSLTDIVDIRAGDEFEVWRANLTRALDQIEPTSLRDWETLQAVLDQHVSEARWHLQTQIGRSKFLGARTDSRRRLGLSAITALVTGGSLAPVALSGGGQYALDLLDAKGTEKTRALLHHLAYFNLVE
jgi:hypothetical protein